MDDLRFQDFALDATPAHFQGEQRTILHNPKGTHVILACAVGGRKLVLEAYRQAIERRYKFGINGDSMLILGNHQKLGAQAI